MEEKANKIRIGVLGAANIAVRSVIPAIESLQERFELVGIGSRSASKKQDVDQQKLIEGYDNLLDNFSLDAVYIPLPNSLHFEWVRKALERGIHVLVEKSLGCSYEEVVELNKLASEKDLVLVENFQFRFHSQLKYVLDVLKDGKLGELRIVRSTFCFPPFPDKENIRYKEELGGGALLDAGAYPVKISQLLLGNDLQVTSAVLNNEDQEVDIWGGAFLQQKNGKLFSEIAFGFDNYYQCSVELVGSKGRLYTNRIFTAGEAVTPTILLETNSEGPKEIKLNPDNHFRNMLVHFSELIKGNQDA
ncbi:Gfo/Idh/MocA family oxidoreductase [Antarcticibacterium sp. 1MA-6-2]|uniref:Gfo/Idh/MocA family protein n=1 Tax=Antarcticibacterium sp. 1MA-6-2 TaxID=2908210 RepID=UPI001F1FE6A8|nr:Gfo/Idh/MocA family oxidoreductase [Antarcticibacterium sp. 1MA-6-2]UJH91295.1 Gfo/Idh/MocA family oxidoreductase [Antarcticibacterium sp. 1MA-6-2]